MKEIEWEMDSNVLKTNMHCTCYFVVYLKIQTNEERVASGEWTEKDERIKGHTIRNRVFDCRKINILHILHAKDF